MEGERIDVGIALRLLGRLEREYGGSRVVRDFRDSARCYHAEALKPFLGWSQCRIRPHFLQPCAPHFNPVERLWGAMHRQPLLNRFHANFRQFTEATSGFLGGDSLPRKREAIADSVTDSSRVITHDRYRMVG